MMNMAACALSPCPHQSAPPRRVAASPTLVVLLNLIHFELDQLHRPKTTFLLVHCNPPTARLARFRYIHKRRGYLVGGAYNTVHNETELRRFIDQNRELLREKEQTFHRQ